MDISDNWIQVEETRSLANLTSYKPTGYLQKLDFTESTTLALSLLDSVDLKAKMESLFAIKGPYRESGSNPFLFLHLEWPCILTYRTALQWAGSIFVHRLLQSKRKKKYLSGKCISANTSGVFNQCGYVARESRVKLRFNCLGYGSSTLAKNINAAEGNSSKGNGKDQARPNEEPWASVMRCERFASLYLRDLRNERRPKYQIIQLTLSPI